MTAIIMSPLQLFKLFPYQLSNKEYLITILPSSYYQLITEHFGEICVILLQTVAKWRCI